MSLTMETTLNLLARDLPTEYRTQLEVKFGEKFEDGEEVPDIPVEVEYDPGWEQAGCRSGHPDNWTPDEGDNPEVTKVEIEGGLDITSSLTPEVISRLEDVCWEDQKKQAEEDFDPPDDYDDYDYDDPANDYINF